MHYVYLIKSKKNNSLYLGSTNDLNRRIKEHNDGKEFFTRRYMPWELVYYEAYREEFKAREREKRLKHNGNAIRELKKRTGLMSDLHKSGAGFKNKSGAGFTMMELLIAMALFATVVALASGIFIRALRTQRATVALVAANSNASLAMEQMSREMRTGSEFSIDSIDIDGHEITFYSAREEGEVTYSWNESDKSIERSDQRITAENVVVENLLFRLCEECGDSYPPRVTFILQISAPGALEQAPFISLQTTVSSRAF